jgi:DNA topoisomerase VI subunit B
MVSQIREVFSEISPADFFYRNRDIAGFSNPSRAIYSTIRELVENSLDACEVNSIPPDVYIRISYVSGDVEGPATYKIRVEDNGGGVPAEHVPMAFGRVFYGSKYKLRQTRGTFGLGGTMAILYGQITTHKPVSIMSSTGSGKTFECELTIDIQRNKPVVLNQKTKDNREKWHGTVVEFEMEGDYPRAMPKILEYFKQTAMVSPYAEIIFVDPRGRLYMFQRNTMKMPNAPQEVKPHPYGVDVETIQRMIRTTEAKDMLSFMYTQFHRVGEKTAKNFLTSKESQIEPDEDPKKLASQEIVGLVHQMKNFKGFLPPDASCLSPLGEELLEKGVQKELDPEFISVDQRKPSAYSGFSFIVETAIAYGGEVQQPGIRLYRFANRIPLLYDEASDVSWKVISTLINWRHYKIAQDISLAIVVHLCSTKIPYKSVGKEFIADRPEVEREILNSIREVARKLNIFLSKKASIQREKEKFDIFSKYMPKIAQFSTKLAEKNKEPTIEPLLKHIIKNGLEE